MQFQIQRRERLADQLYGKILELIVSGDLDEGARLPSESQICDQFGVSRPIVREALRKLQSDGLVYARQGVGTFVKTRPPQGLIEYAASADVAGILRCMEARLAIEGASARLAATRASGKALAEIDRSLATLGSGIRSGEVPHGADFAFHLAVAEASGNEIFPELLKSLEPTMRQGMGVALSITRQGSIARAERVWREHRHIAEAIRGRDAESAEVLMRYHLLQARHRVTDHAEQD
jgi:DNA-binding FadR family transcriptional regulator